MSKYLRLGKKKDSHKTRSTPSSTSASPTLLRARGASAISQSLDHSPGVKRQEHSSIYEPDTVSLFNHDSTESPQTDSETESWVDLKGEISGPSKKNATMIQGSKNKDINTDAKSSENSENKSKQDSSKGDELKLTIDMVRELGLNLAHPNVFKTVVISFCIYHFPKFVFNGFIWLFILCLLHEPLRKPVREAVVTGFVGFLAVVNGFAVTLIQSIRVSMRQLRKQAEERPK